MYLVIFGAPGAGKGTQADIISQKFSIPHISTGDIFRDEVNKGTDLGKSVVAVMKKGSLVPDNIVIDIVRKRTAQPDCESGFILDGFPRTITQAKGLENMLGFKNKTVNKVISIDVTESELISRLSARWICPNCNQRYNTTTLAPKKTGICDYCDNKLFQREDDKPDTIKKRLAVYFIETQPLLDYYSGKNILVSIDGNRGIEEISGDIIAVLST